MKFKKYFWILLIFAVAWSVSNIFASFLTGVFFEWIFWIDPDGVYNIEPVIHSVVQFFIVMILLNFYFNESFYELGFNFQNKKLSMKYLGYTIILFPVLAVAYYFLAVKFIGDYPEYIAASFPAKAENVFGALWVDLLMVNCFAAEPLFRVFVISALLKYWKGSISILNLQINSAVVIAAVIYSLSGFAMTFAPFQIISPEPVHLVISFFTGLIFGSAYVKTGSLFYPVAGHSFISLVLNAGGFIASCSL